MPPYNYKQFKRIEYTLEIEAQNIGSIYANYINVFIKVPNEILPEEERHYGNIFGNPKDKYVVYTKDNTVRDIVDVKVVGLNGIPKYGPSRYNPILPKLSKIWTILLCDCYDEINRNNIKILWDIYADNANPMSGSVMLEDIDIEEIENV